MLFKKGFRFACEGFVSCPLSFLLGEGLPRFSHCLRQRPDDTAGSCTGSSTHRRCRKPACRDDRTQTGNGQQP